MISLTAMEASASAWASEHAKMRRIEKMATWCGWQPDGCGGGFDLWNLLVDVPGHPAGSTVTTATIEENL